LNRWNNVGAGREMKDSFDPRHRRSHGGRVGDVAFNDRKA